MEARGLLKHCIPGGVSNRCSVCGFMHMLAHKHTQELPLYGLSFTFSPSPTHLSFISHLSCFFISLSSSHISLPSSSIFVSLPPLSLSSLPLSLAPSLVFLSLPLYLSPPGCTRVTRAGDRWYPRGRRPNQWQRLTLHMMSMILNSHYRLEFIKL